jgi:hypothetical protein
MIDLQAVSTGLAAASFIFSVGIAVKGKIDAWKALRTEDQKHLARPPAGGLGQHRPAFPP